MFLIVLSALFLLFDIPLIGVLTGTEVLFLLLFPFCLSKAKFFTKEEKYFYVCAGLWLIGAIFTDIIRQTSMHDFLRGWSKIIFFAINFTVIRAIIGQDLHKMRVFVFLLFAAMALRLVTGAVPEGLKGIDMNLSIAWKFGYGQFFSISMLFVCAYFIARPATKIFGFSLSYVTSVVNLYFNARNLTGTTALAAIASSFTGSGKRKISKGKLLLILFMLGLGGIGAIQGYKFAASKGFLGQAAQDKFENQTQGDLGLIISGRPEILASSQAIKDSPIIGHGSWARNIYYVKIKVEALMRSGERVTGNPYASDLIPSHSHLMGAWVEHGVLGAIFWFWAMWLVGQALLATLGKPSQYTGVHVFVFISMLWDILFSPFGLTARITMAALIYWAILVANEKNIAHNATELNPEDQKDDDENLSGNRFLQSGKLSGKNDPISSLTRWRRD